MCGLFQVFQKGRPISQPRFRAALDSMQHRGPDSTGVAFDEHLFSEGGETVYAAHGHQRLAILDLTDSSQQPYRRQGCSLIYNGELYNFRELAERLRQRGDEIEASGDTEVLFHSLATEGADALPNFSGMWGFSFFDPDDASLLISRDRYGKKPLFYYQDDTLFCVSSTIRAILTYLDTSPVFRRSALLSYFLSGTMYPGDSEETHFEGINQFLPGHVGRFDLRRWDLQSRPYFDWFEPGQDPATLDESTLAESVQCGVLSRLVSDRPVALLLSGGVDSSLVLSVLHATGAHERLQVFLGDTGRCADYSYAQQCVERLGVQAETIVLDYQTQTFDLFLDICTHHEKPFLFNGNAMAMPQMYRAIAQRGIPVVLDGTGGDEFFGGYWPRHLPNAFRQAISESNTSWIGEVCNANRNSKFLRHALAWARRDRSAISAGGAIWRAITGQLHPFIRCSWREALEFQNPDPLPANSTSFNETLCRDVAPGGRLGEWIWHNDRNAMMSSVENRSPLLDHRLHPFLFSGYQNKYVGEWNKHELRSVFSQFAPLPTQWRRDKQGFRWDGRRFIRNHQRQILELIDESTWCSEVFNNHRFVRAASRVPKLLSSSLGKQALCIAGLEASMRRAA